MRTVLQLQKHDTGNAKPKPTNLPAFRSMLHARHAICMNDRSGRTSHHPHGGKPLGSEQLVLYFSALVIITHPLSMRKGMSSRLKGILVFIHDRVRGSPMQCEHPRTVHPILILTRRRPGTYLFRSSQSVAFLHPPSIRSRVCNSEPCSVLGFGFCRQANGAVIRMIRVNVSPFLDTVMAPGHGSGPRSVPAICSLSWLEPGRSLPWFCPDCTLQSR